MKCLISEKSSERNKGVSLTNSTEKWNHPNIYESVDMFAKQVKLELACRDPLCPDKPSKEYLLFLNSSFMTVELVNMAM